MFTRKRLEKTNSLFDPFPVLEFKNFLNKKEAAKAYEIIKNIKDFDEENEMGGRNNLRKGTKKHKKFLKENSLFRGLYSFFNDEKQFHFLYKELKALSEKSKAKYEPKYIQNKINKDYYAYKSTVHKKNYLKRIKNYFWSKLPLSARELKKLLFFDFVIAKATKGYTTGPHLDKKTRIIIFLIYFNKLPKDSGGSLEVYSQNSKNTPNNEKNLKNGRWSGIFDVSKSGLSLAHTVKPEPGKMVCFLANPISFHNAELMKLNKVNRCFIYGSYSLRDNVKWIKC